MRDDIRGTYGTGKVVTSEYDPQAQTPAGLADSCMEALLDYQDPESGDHIYQDQAIDMLNKTVYKVTLNHMPPELQYFLLTKPAELFEAMRAAALAIIESVHHDYSLEIRNTMRLEIEADVSSERHVTREQAHQFVAIEGRVKSFDAIQQVSKNSEPYKCQNCGVRHASAGHNKKCAACGEPTVKAVAPDKDDLVDQRFVELILGGDSAAGSQYEQSIWLTLERDLAHIPLSLSQHLRADGIVMLAKNQSKQPIPDIEAYYPYIYVNSIKATEKKQRITLTDQDRAYYQQWAKETGSAVIPELTEAFAAKLHGLDSIKESILLQTVGAEFDGNKARPDIHIMLIGDPSMGKTDLALEAELVCDAAYSTGEGISAAGVAAGVVKDEKTGRYVVQAGIAVEGNRRLKCLDEIDKMHREYLKQLYTVLDKGFYRLDKIVHETYETAGPWLVTGNPKGGRYDPDKTLYQNIDFPMPLLSRFDLIWVMVRQYNPEHTEKKLQAINTQYKKSAAKTHKDAVWLAKYLLACKELRDISIRQEVFDVLGLYFHKLEKAGANGDYLPITERQYHAMLRLAIASAKIHMRKEVTEQDAARAMRLMSESLGVAALDKETGVIDIAVITGGTPKSEKEKAKIVKTILGQLTRSRQDTISEEILVQDMLKTMRWPDAEACAGFLQTLRIKGDIQSPASGWWCLG